MDKSSVQKLVYVLRVLVTITFVCNLVALLVVPMMACMYGVMTVGGIVGWGIDGLSYLFGLTSTPRDYFPFIMMFFPPGLRYG